MTISWFTPLSLLALYGLVRFFIRNKNGRPIIDWTPLESVGVTLAIYFGAQIVGGIIVYLLPTLAGYDQARALDWIENNAYGQFIFITIYGALTIWLIRWFLKRRKSSLAAIGFKGRPRWQDAVFVLIGFVAYFLLFAVATALAKHFIPGINLDQAQEIGFKNPSSLQLPLIFLGLVIFTPFIEEITVRGFLYTGLKKGLHVLWATLITCGLFGIAHLQAGSGEPLLWIAAIDTFVLSLVLVRLREKTGNLWASIGLHMLKNLIAFLYLFVFHVK